MWGTFCIIYLSIYKKRTMVKKMKFEAIIVFNDGKVMLRSFLTHAEVRRWTKLKPFFSGSVFKNVEGNLVKII